MNKIENFKGKGNSNGFTSNPENINKKGRKPSLKKQLSSIALQDGYLTFKKSEVIVEGDKVRVKVPTEEQMAIKLFDIALGKNPNAAISAIKLYLETFDGKATQPIEDVTRPEDTEIAKLPAVAKIAIAEFIQEQKDKYLV